MEWTKGFFAQSPEELESKINDFFAPTDNGITKIHYEVTNSGDLGIYYTAIVHFSTFKNLNPVKVFVADSPEVLEQNINFFIVDNRAEIDVSNYAALYTNERFVFSYIATFKKNE